MNVTGDGGLFSLAYALESHGKFTQHYSTTTIALCLVTLLTAALGYFNRGNKSSSIVDMDGVPIKQVDSDTRYTRFAKGLQLSTDGENLAQDEPYVIRNGGNWELVIHTSEQVREFYRKDGKDHSKPKDMNLGDYFGRILGQCVGLQAGAKWKNTRSHFDPEFSHQVSVKSISGFANELNLWLDALPLNSKPAGTLADTHRSFSSLLAQSCKFLPFRLIALSLYGDGFNDEVYSRLMALNELHSKIMFVAAMGKRETYRMYNWLPTTAKRQMDAFHKEWESLNIDIIQSVRQRDVTCPIERIYRAVDQEGDMTMSEFLQTLDEILFTNIDITGNILIYMLTALATHPSFQASLHAEMVRERGSPTFDIAQYVGRQDTLLHYLILESLRMRPPFHLSLPENTATVKIIGRYRIPAHTPTVIDVRRLNRNPITWGPDGDLFRPERFRTLTPAHYRYGFMKFGVGSGKCMGKHVADVMLKMTAVKVLERYEMATMLGDGGVVKDGEVRFEKR